MGTQSLMHAVDYASSPEKISRCYCVMRELRPAVTEEEFIPRIQRLQAAGYRLIYVEADGEVKSVAGFQISECLAWNRFLYVYDLVTKASQHGRGFGTILFDWLMEHARTQACEQLHLDSGVQRFGAHRFYLGRGMDITAHHFGIKLLPVD